MTDHHGTTTFKTSTIATVATIVTVVASWLIYNSLSKFQKNPTVPGPKPYPFLGNLTHILPYIRSKSFHLFTDLMVSTYGPISQMFLPNGTSHVLISDAATAKKIHMDVDTFPRTNFGAENLDGIARYLLLFLPTDQTWRRHRKLMAAGFGPAHIKHTVDAVNDIMESLFSKWESELRKDEDGVIEINFSHIAVCITTDVIGLVAFSYDFECVKDPDSPRVHRIAGFGADVSAMVSKRLTLPRMLWGWFGIAKKDGEALMSEYTKPITDALNLKREIKRKEKEGSKLVDASLERRIDVMDKLLEADDWTDLEVVDETVILFAAGSDTSSNTITFVIQFLVNYPDVFKKLRQELDSHLGAPSMSKRASKESQSAPKLSFETLNKLIYLDQIVKETMRVSSTAVSSSSRVVTKHPVTILDHTLEPGTHLNIYYRALQLDPQYWGPDADEFRPERWDDGFTPVPGSYSPFGDGPHICLGYKMAMVEMKSVLALFVHGYDFELVPGQTLVGVQTVTYGFKNGMRIFVRRRKS
jgi:cytochrome P450